MAIPAGTRLGQFEILSALGKGGMGDVYRANDTRLRREVALKILPAEFATDRDRLRRMEQEAMAAASLNHPNVLVTHDIGSFEGVPFIVSELLTGRTLRDELRDRGALPVGVAVEYARQIGSGLAAAHSRGVIHRDVKPENLFITADGVVKILDFGLAKVRETPRSAANPADQPPTMTATGPGLVLGTIGYMSPEQARGLTADHRSDIFSLGAVLYEMLTGQRAFSGATDADALSALLKDDVVIPATDSVRVPPSLARVVHRCLNKTPERRFQSASDLGFALELSQLAEARVTPPAEHSRGASNGLMAASLAAIALLGLIGVAAAWIRQDANVPRSTNVLRFTLPDSGSAFGTGAGTGSRTSIDISPDGRHVAFVGQSTAGTAVWIKPLDSLDAKVVPGTEDADGRVFWSPDGESIGFFAGGKLKVVNLTGSHVRSIADAVLAGPNADGTWASDGTILYSAGRGSIVLKASQDGGVSTAVTRLLPTETGHLLPQFLDDNKHFVYVVQSSTADAAGVFLGSVEGTPAVRLLNTPSPIAVAPSRHLLFIQDRAIAAQLIDPVSRRLTGEPQALFGESNVNLGMNRLGFVLAVSRTGILLRSHPGAGEQRFVWTDRSGRDIGTAGEPGLLGNFDLSPDDRQLAFSRSEPGGSSIWAIDFTRNVTTRLTSQRRSDTSPVWSPRADRIAFTRGSTSGPQVVSIRSTGGDEMALTEVGTPAQVDDWSPDGKFVSFNSDPLLLVVPTTGGKSVPFVRTDGKNVDESHFSPDGKWVAYNSNESGTWQVYVAPFPPTGERWQVSANGGVEGRWRADGRELFFLSPDGEMMSVEVGVGERFQAGGPQRLFDARVSINPRADHFAVTRDGQRFLIKRDVGRAERDPWTVIVNWPQLLPNADRR
jgi:serine/threonine protein kinase/Tol biopolymer transport system component